MDPLSDLFHLCRIRQTEVPKTQCYESVDSAETENGKSSLQTPLCQSHHLGLAPYVKRCLFC